MDLKKLKEEMPFNWKVQTYVSNQTKGICVAYIDARQASDKLDDVVGAVNWKDEYEEIKGSLFCGVSIKINDEWVTKWDCGVESAVEKEKGESSDSFKRACVKWGIGKFLYTKETKWIDIQNKKPVDNNGKTIYDLTKHFNSPIKPQKAPIDVKTPVGTLDTIKAMKALKNRLYALGAKNEQEALNLIKTNTGLEYKKLKEVPNDKIAGILNFIK